MNNGQIAEIAELIQLNCSTESYLLSAEILGEEQLASRFRDIISIHNHLKYMPPSLNEKRAIHFDRLKAAAEYKLDPEVYEAWCLVQ